MKLLVCSLIIFAQINNNSKASLDSFAPTNLNILLEDTTRNTGNIFLMFFITISLFAFFLYYIANSVFQLEKSVVQKTSQDFQTQLFLQRNHATDHANLM